MVNETGAPEDGAVVPEGERGTEPYERPGFTWTQELQIQAKLSSACGLIGGGGDPGCEGDPSS